jgi:hypothetical protein
VELAWFITGLTLGFFIGGTVILFIFDEEDKEDVE